MKSAASMRAARSAPGSRVFDASLFGVSLAVSLAFFLFAPLDGTPGTISVTAAFFGALTSVALAVVAALRYEFAHRGRNTRWLFIWILPVATVLIMIPWLLSPAFPLPELGGILGAFPLFTLLAYAAGLAGLIIAAFVLVPVELFVRGVIELVRSRGRAGYGKLVVALCGFLLIAFIAVGVAAASSGIRVNVDGQLLAALLGLPGDYTIKDDRALVVARVLGAAVVVTPIVYGMTRRRFADNVVMREVTGLIP